jgi:hypothetical protein
MGRLGIEPKGRFSASFKESVEGSGISLVAQLTWKQREEGFPAASCAPRLSPDYQPVDEGQRTRSLKIARLYRRRQRDCVGDYC